MKKIYTALSLLLLTVYTSNAQTNYSFAASAGTYATIYGAIVSLPNLTTGVSTMRCVEAAYITKSVSKYLV